MLKKCHHCGAENAQPLRYCKSCGVLLNVSGTRENLLDDWVEELSPVRMSDLGLPTPDEVKKRKQTLVGGLAVGVCLIGFGFGVYKVEQSDLKQAKKVYASEQGVQLEDLKSQLTESDWSRFEQFILGEAKDILKRSQKGKLTYREALTELERVEFLMKDSSISNDLIAIYEQLEQLNASKEAFRQGEILKEEGNILEAYRSFRLVSEETKDYKMALAYQKELKQKAVSEWLKEAEGMIAKNQYAEAKASLDELSTIDSQNANLLALKKQVEKLMEVEGVSVEESKSSQTESVEEVKTEQSEIKPVEVEAGELLKHGQVLTLDGLKIDFKMARFATNIKPDLIERDENADRQIIYEAKEGYKFFDFIFRLTNESDSSVDLATLMTEASLLTADGKLYEEATYFYSETAKKLIPMYQWATLEESEVTTYRVAIQVPESVEEVGAKGYLTIGGQRYEVHYNSDLSEK